jgi:aspartate/methionine/tyrosine aminotransferase
LAFCIKWVISCHIVFLWFEGGFFMADENKQTLFDQVIQNAVRLAQGNTEMQKRNLFGINLGRWLVRATRGLADAVEDQLRDPRIVAKIRQLEADYVEGKLYGLRESEESSTLKAGAEAKEAAKTFKEKNPSESDLVNMTLGQPNANPPKSYLENVVKRILGIKNWGYGPTGGDPEILKDIIRYMQNLGYPERIFIGEKEVPIAATMVSGAKSVLAAAMKTVVPNGKTDMMFVTLKSKWVSYSAQIQNAGGVEMSIDRPPDESEMTDEQLKAFIDELEGIVRENPDFCLIINEPTNPSGGINNKLLRAVADFVKRHPKVKVIQDSIYLETTHDGKQPAQLLEAIEPSIAGRILTVYSLAKCAPIIPGERAGMGIGNCDWIKAMVDYLSNVAGNPPHSMQMFVAEAVKPSTEECADDLQALNKKQNTIYTQNAKTMRECFVDMGIKCSNPSGAFYVEVDFEEFLKAGLETSEGKPVRTSEDVRKLLLEHGVATTPGKDFGSESILRFAYAISPEDATLAVNRIQKTFGALTRRGQNMTFQESHLAQLSGAARA